MAEFNTHCPHCNTELVAEEDWIGMEVECPFCKKNFTISQNKIQISCSHCGQNFEVQTDWIGQTATCQNCGQEFIIQKNRISANIFLWFSQTFPNIHMKKKSALICLSTSLGIVILLFSCIGYGMYKHHIAEEKRIAEEKKISEEIKRKIETANNANTAEDAISILQEILSKHPNHHLSSEIKELIDNKKQYIEECQIVRSAIQKAKDVKTYQEAFSILEKIITDYPNNFYIADARKLLERYKYEFSHPRVKIKLSVIIPAVSATGNSKNFTMHLSIYVNGNFVEGTIQNCLYNSFIFVDARKGDTIKVYAEVRNIYGALQGRFSDEKIVTQEIMEKSDHFMLFSPM